MNVSLTPQLEKEIERLLKTGRYTSASEIVRHALRVFQQHQEIEERYFQKLKEEVLLGHEQVKRGEYMPFDDKAVEEIKAAGRKKFKESHKKNK